MKKSILIITLGVLVNQHVCSQWSEQNSGITSDLYAVSASSNDVVWACGAEGKVLLTTNGGTNWLVTTVPDNTLELGAIWGVDASSALVTGTGASSLVYKTTNGGLNWTQVFSQAGGFINSFWMHSEHNGFMIGDPVNNRWSLWKTSNGGTSWDSSGMYLPDTAGVFSFNNALFSTGSHIWFGTNGRKIFYSSNSGTNWTAQAAAGKVIAAVIWFNSINNGMAGGSAPIIFTTTGGNTWATLPGTTSVHGMTGYGTSWWYVRIVGTVYNSTNNGSNWSIAYTAPSGLYIHIARARNNTNMWAVRTGGGISKYTASPSEVTSFAILKINELKYSVNGLVSSGHLKHAFGKVLNNFLDHAINNINSGHFEVAINQMQLFNNEVDRLISLGFLTVPLGQPLISSGEDIISLIQQLIGGDNFSSKQNETSSYVLEQNFPNPFNPVTKIGFSVPRAGLVKLIVYDITGREIATVINEFKEAGNHAAEFDGTGIASGVYFYRLTAGSYTNIKKMILIK